jgi:membrane protein required for colicin V production
VAKQIGSTVKVSEHWLPVLSFIVVFIAVLLLVRLGAKAIEQTVQLAMLGWANRLGGIIFYIAIYIGIASVALFYADQLKWLQPEVKEKSVTYPYVAPAGPRAISAIGYAIPLFKDTFSDLETFFGGVSDSIEPAPRP